MTSSMSASTLRASTCLVLFSGKVIPVVVLMLSVRSFCAVRLTVRSAGLRSSGDDDEDKEAEAVTATPHCVLPAAFVITGCSQ